MLNKNAIKQCENEKQKKIVYSINIALLLVIGILAMYLILYFNIDIPTPEYILFETSQDAVLVNILRFSGDVVIYFIIVYISSKITSIITSLLIIDKKTTNDK